MLGGYALAPGVLLVALAITALRARHAIAVAGVLIGGASSIGLMSAVNFTIGSDFRWPLFARDWSGPSASSSMGSKAPATTIADK